MGPTELVVGRRNLEQRLMAGSTIGVGQFPGGSVTGEDGSAARQGGHVDQPPMRRLGRLRWGRRPVGPGLAVDAGRTRRRHWFRNQRNPGPVKIVLENFAHVSQVLVLAVRGEPLELDAGLGFLTSAKIECLKARFNGY